MMLYKIRAYESLKEAKSGHGVAQYESTTGNYKNAETIAKELANHYGACLVYNTQTGNTVQFIK